MQGIITEIQRCSLHDGPGIRTTVFLKGCNLRCAWCHNPETQRPRAELQHFPDKCIGCGACLRACEHGAMVEESGVRVYYRERCIACGACARGCYAEALVLVGREASVEEVLAEIVQDRTFYDNTGGGVTLSGGEPLLQRDFARALLAACKAEGISTAIESDLAFPWEQIAPLLDVLDLVMFDIKAADPELHVRWTGQSNARVLENVRRLGETGLPLIARTPVIAGVNASEEEIGRIADILAGLPNLLYYELLPYHPLGTGKYRSLDMPEPPAEFSRPPAEVLERLAEAARARGLSVRVAGQVAKIEARG